MVSGTTRFLHKESPRRYHLFRDEPLASHWPACRTNHTLAAVKLHTVLNVRGKGPQRVKITSERVHDGPVLRAGQWVKGRLLLFDLGYFRYSLFAAIMRHGGFFLTRLKDNANPTLLRLHRHHRGRAVAVEGPSWPRGGGGGTNEAAPQTDEM